MVESLKSELEKEELRKLIFNRKLTFMDEWDNLGLSKKKREEFLDWYWDNVKDYTLLTGLDEFKKK